MSATATASIPGGIFVVPPGITQTTIAALQQHRSEAVCFWLGRLGLESTTVEEVWIPKFEASAVSYDIMPIEMLRLKAHLDKAGMVIAAQVHSHPGEAFHSSTDDLHAASPWPGFVSIVVPRFGRLRRDFWNEVGIYELLGGGRWRHITTAERSRRFMERENASS